MVGFQQVRFVESCLTRVMGKGRQKAAVLEYKKASTASPWRYLEGACMLINVCVTEVAGQEELLVQRVLC